LKCSALKFTAATQQYKWGQSKAVKIFPVPYELLTSHSIKKERAKEQKGGEQKPHGSTEISCVDLVFLIMGFHRITESQNSRGWKGPLWVI